MELYYDLHIHSCLSPCGDADMTPNNIAGMAHIKGLDIIALTDHNAGRNVPALMEAAKKYAITVVPGMELTTAEEVHALCFFPDVEALLEFERLVYQRLQKVANRPEVFGTQIVMNENDEPVAAEEYLLINATDISFQESGRLAADYGGLMIPAHIDKPTNALISNLGAIPPDATFPCAEIRDLKKKEALLLAHPYLKNCRFISDSDAHMLPDISERIHALPFAHMSPTAKEVLEVLSARA